jgi:DNA-directed RNA polymerase subunit RPC12/RpoP
MARSLEKQINALINSIERPQKTYKCKNCQFEKFIYSECATITCPECGSRMVSEDLFNVTGVKEIDDRQWEEYFNAKYPQLKNWDGKHLDIEDMDSTAWMML